MFLDTFKGDSRMLQGYLKYVPRVFQGNFMAVSKTYQGCLKKVSSVFQENFKKTFLGCFQNVSIKFCFVILLLHGGEGAEGGLVNLITLSVLARSGSLCYLTIYTLHTVCEKIESWN